MIIYPPPEIFLKFCENGSKSPQRRQVESSKETALGDTRPSRRINTRQSSKAATSEYWLSNKPLLDPQAALKAIK